MDKQRSTQLKETLNSVLDEIVACKEDYVKDPARDFTRNRKLGMKTVMSIILSMGGKSIKKELYDLFPDIDDRMTTSAFVQARGKILPEAFRDAFDLFNIMTEDLDDKCYRGYRLYAADGTAVNIAYNEDSDTHFPNGPNKGFNQMHINALYDLGNLTYKDVIIQPRPKMNEIGALNEMLKSQNFKHPSILLADRGYGSFNLFERINRMKNLDYLFRVKTDFCKETSDLAMVECDIDRHIQFRTSQTKADIEAFKNGTARWISGPSKFGKPKVQMTWEFENPFDFNFRIVRFLLPSGEYETIVTSLNRFEFPLEEIKKLYFMRWGIETSFRELKYSMGLINFHAVREDFVIQEIYARLLGFNFAMRIAGSIDVPQSGENKYEYAVNLDYAMYVARRFIWSDDKESVEADIVACLEPYRPGRKDKRKIVLPKSVIPFIYRVA